VGAGTGPGGVGEGVGDGNGVGPGGPGGAGGLGGAGGCRGSGGSAGSGGSLGSGGSAAVGSNCADHEVRRAVGTGNVGTNGALVSGVGPVGSASQESANASLISSSPPDRGTRVGSPAGVSPGQITRGPAACAGAASLSTCAATS